MASPSLPAGAQGRDGSPAPHSLPQPCPAGFPPTDLAPLPTSAPDPCAPLPGEGVSCQLLPHQVRRGNSRCRCCCASWEVCSPNQQAPGASDKGRFVGALKQPQTGLMQPPASPQLPGSPAPAPRAGPSPLSRWVLLGDEGRQHLMVPAEGAKNDEDLPISPEARAERPVSREPVSPDPPTCRSAASTACHGLPPPLREDSDNPQLPLAAEGCCSDFALSRPVFPTPQISRVAVLIPRTSPRGCIWTSGLQRGD